MLKPIRNKADYEANLACLEALMDAAPGTPEGDELEIIASLVERYEDERFPIELPTPLAAIRFRMEQQDCSTAPIRPHVCGLFATGLDSSLATFSRVTGSDRRRTSAGIPKP